VSSLDGEKERMAREKTWKDARREKEKEEGNEESRTCLALWPNVVCKVGAVEGLLMDVRRLHLEELHRVLEQALVGCSSQSLEVGGGGRQETGKGG
jgi:hypothetical protein